MVGETSGVSGTYPIERRAARIAVWWAMAIGLILALVGLIDGIKMASKSRVTQCPNGTFFPEGTTNFNCYVHPNAGIGTAVAVVSALLGILVALSAVSAVALLRSRSADRAQP